MSTAKQNLTKLGSKTEYVDKYDPSLLEPISRSERRNGYTAPMNGYDIWTCYEFSFLQSNGYPSSHVIRIVNPASSEIIFESKSLKLYLNSFNNTKFNNLNNALATVRYDLTKFCGTDIDVFEVDTFLEPKKYMLYNRATNLDPLSRNFNPIKNYQYNPALLNEGIYRIVSEDQQIKKSFFTDNLRSNCEITNQPDFGRILIQYTTDGFDINPENLLRYIVSFRNHQEFHEPTCERIYNDLFTILKPKHLLVLCQYTRRGGIDINPYRQTEKEPINYYNLPKLIQQ